MPAQGEPQPTSVDASISGLPPITATRPASQPGGFRGFAGKVAGALGRGQGEAQGTQPSYVVSHSLGEPTTPPQAPAWTPDAAPGVQPAGNPDLTGTQQAPELPPDPWTQPAAEPAPTLTGTPTPPDGNPVVTPEPVAPALSDVPEPTFPAAPMAPQLPEDPFAPKPTPTPAAPRLTDLPDVVLPSTPAANPTPAVPAPSLSDVEVPFAPSATPGGQVDERANQEPTEAPAPIVDVSSVWTPEPHDAALEPQPQPAPWDRSAGEPIDSDTAPVASEKASGAETSATDTPMFRKVVDGDLVRYELTPEGRQKMGAAFTKMIESGALDDFAAELAESMAKTPTDSTSAQSNP